MRNQLLLLILPLLLGSCATGCPKVEPCPGFEAIYVHQGDMLTDATAKEILAHDLYGQKKCGWKKP